MSSVESPFNSDALRYIELIDKLELAKWKTRYSFSSMDYFQTICKQSTSRGNQIYWEEIVARAHLTAVTTILRSRQWINAVTSSVRDNNLLSFSAALRGLIESVADSATILGHVPLGISRNSAHIIRALSGEINNGIFVAENLEDSLIHFAYARKLTKDERLNFPESHHAKSVRDYIEVLENWKIQNIIECYRELCDLTHPGSSSVSMWLNHVSELEIELKVGQGKEIISRFLTEYRMTIFELIMIGFNPAIVTLKLLNYFPLVKFHVPSLELWDLTGNRMWQQCLIYLEGRKSNIKAHLKVV